MFINAIEKVVGYTRALHTITREYNNNTVIPGQQLYFLLMNSEKQ